MCEYQERTLARLIKSNPKPQTERLMIKHERLYPSSKQVSDGLLPLIKARPIHYSATTILTKARTTLFFLSFLLTFFLLLSLFLSFFLLISKYLHIHIYIFFFSQRFVKMFKTRLHRELLQFFNESYALLYESFERLILYLRS